MCIFKDKQVALLNLKYFENYIPNDRVTLFNVDGCTDVEELRWQYKNCCEMINRCLNREVELNSLVKRLQKRHTELMDEIRELRKAGQRCLKWGFHNTKDNKIIYLDFNTESEARNYIADRGLHSMIHIPYSYWSK